MRFLPEGRAGAAGAPALAGLLGRPHVFNSEITETENAHFSGDAPFQDKKILLILSIVC